MVRLGRLFFGALVLTTVSGQPGTAAEARHSTEYTIALSGLPIARASFSTSLDNSSFTITGDIKSAGIANIITTISAQTTVSGTMKNDRLRPKNYLLNYTSGKKTRIYEVGFRNGNVTSTAIRPEPRRNPKTWVAVTESDLRAVLDPISGVIFPADQPVCPATLPIFDGESRMDLVLKPKGTKPFATDGFKGDAIVCSVRYVPRSGFKKNRSDITYLQKLKSMEIWFAKADAVNMYAPVYVKIPTYYGIVTISAVKFGS